jgi:hypothetical protein
VQFVPAGISFSTQLDDCIYGVATMKVRSTHLHAYTPSLTLNSVTLYTPTTNVQVRYKLRNKPVLIVLFIRTCVLNLLFGLIFYQVGKLGETPDDVRCSFPDPICSFPIHMLVSDPHNNKNMLVSEPHLLSYGYFDSSMRPV